MNIPRRDRVRCYAAFAFVARENKPKTATLLLGEINELFANLRMVDAQQLADILDRSGDAFTHSRMNLVISYSGARRVRNAYQLRPEVYTCLSNALTAETGRGPADGVNWVAERYRQSPNFKPSPMSIFNRALTGVGARK